MADIYKVDFRKKRLVSKNGTESEFSPRDIEKYEYFCELIDKGLTQVIVNSNVADVILPEILMGSVATHINWSHRFLIPDFEYDEVGVRGTLSFSQKNCYVDLPWASIWMIYQPEHGKASSKAWKEDAPGDLIRITEESLEEEGN